MLKWYMHTHTSFILYIPMFLLWFPIHLYTNMYVYFTLYIVKTSFFVHVFKIFKVYQFHSNSTIFYLPLPFFVVPSRDVWNQLLCQWLKKLNKFKGLILLEYLNLSTNTLFPWPTFIHPPRSTHSGVHDGRVLSTDVGGPQADVRGAHWNFTAQQPDGDQGLDARHLLQKRQEVGRSQHDGAKQALPHHEERHHSVHHEVEQHTQKQKACKPAAWAAPRSQTSAPSTGTSAVGHGAGSDSLGKLALSASFLWLHIWHKKSIVLHSMVR